MVDSLDAINHIFYEFTAEYCLLSDDGMGFVPVIATTD